MVTSILVSDTCLLALLLATLVGSAYHSYGHEDADADDGDDAVDDDDDDDGEHDDDLMMLSMRLMMVITVMLKIRPVQICVSPPQAVGLALCSFRNSKDKHTNKDMHL